MTIDISVERRRPPRGSAGERSVRSTSTTKYARRRFGSTLTGERTGERDERQKCR
jgi:hypothetical protein